MGRVYLPKEDRRRFGYSDADLNGRITNTAFLNLMQFEVERTRTFLESVFPLADALAGRLRIEIELFGRGGLRVLERIEANGFRVWDKRPVISKWDIARMFLSTIGRALVRPFRHRQSRPEVVVIGSDSSDAVEPKP
jgi:phytoene/squalene synthetase